MTSWVIVAVPERSDSVWEISSEKVPHMTLLYLGEQESPELASHIAQTLQHVTTTTLYPFGLWAKTRGTLGEEGADVLFFDKSAPMIKELEAFRQNLLRDTAIFEAYGSAEQYPEWTPHLTLGYPDNPATEPEEVRPNSTWVHFNRIELWVGDSEGPGFDLEERELMYSDTVDTFLAHYGVKGMKWGVQKDQVMLDKISGRKTKASGGTRAERKQMTQDRKKAWKEYKNSTSRKERKSDKLLARSEKASYIFEEAMTNPRSMVAINTPGSPTYKTMVTGKEFVNYVSKGGAFDVLTAELFELEDSRS